MKKMKVLKGAALAALLALSLIATAGQSFFASSFSGGDQSINARGRTQGVTWENGTAARGKSQGVTWEGVTWE